MTVQGLEQVAFEGGRITISQGVRALREQGLNVHELLQRHFLGDDGDVTERDHTSNVAARRALPLITECKFDRVFSAYETALGRVWIITEADRSYTTVLLPSEY